MLDILNKILMNQLDPKTVTDKLDEILEAVNQRIPVDRRLTADQKVMLTACLKKIPGQYMVASISSREAFTYAQDWSDVFLAAGWTNKEPIPVVTALPVGVFPPVVIALHGTFDQVSQTGSLIGGSPERNALQCLNSANIPGGGTARPSEDVPTGTIQITITDRQNQ